MDACHRVSGALFLFAGGLAFAQTQSGSSVPAVETILTRMAQARAENRTHLRPYTVIRDYRLFGKERLTTKAEVIADLTFVPRTSNATPSGRRTAWDWEKIVRQMLEHETDIVKTTAPPT